MTFPPRPRGHTGRRRRRARSRRRTVVAGLLLGLLGVAAVALAVVAAPRLLDPADVEVPLENSGFEAGGAAATAEGWTDTSTNGNETAAYTEAGGHTGGFRLSHWSPRAYQVETYLYLPLVEDGRYTLRVWARSSGGQDAAYVALRNCGPANEPRTTLPTGDNWRRVSVTADVTAGRCTISVVSQGRADTWANIDDVDLVRVPGGRHAATVPVVGALLLTVPCLVVGGSVVLRRRASRPTAAAAMRDDERQRRLVADVAHELRTPLSTVRSYLEALIDGVLPADKEVFVSLHDEALLQQRIIDDLQDLTLADAGAMTYHNAPVHLADLLRTCRNALLMTAGSAGVRLSVQTVESRAATVNGDADRLRQVIGNLMGNALRHTPAGGSITLRCGVTGDDAVLTVTDTGSGIAADDLPHVFDRFWRAENSRGRGAGGSGLGLAIARRIVVDHGGDITVRSRLGHGTTFVLRLPLDGPGAPATPTADRRTASGHPTH